VAVRIRLRRIGKKKQPQYRLIVADSSSPRDGRFIESIGRYNPRVEPALVSVDEERALWWLRQGAQPSDTALSLLKKSGVWETFTGEPAGAAGQVAVAEEPVAAGESGAPEAPEEDTGPGEDSEKGTEAPEPEPTPE
jgi:small subunit ribosomal protein S16